MSEPAGHRAGSAVREGSLMKALLPFIVVGVATGSVYALAAVGLVLTFKTSGVFNFGHGAQAAMAAYMMFEFRQRMGLPWPLAGLLALLVAGVALGLVLERIATVLARASTGARVAATVGLMVAIQGVLVAVFGSATLQMTYFLPTHLWRVFGVNIRVEQVIVTGLVFGAVIGLSALLTWTRLGVAMRAAVDNPGLLDLEGTDPVAVRRWAWIIGSCFAAISGMVLAPTIGLDASILTLLVFYAFGAAAVGAFRSIPLTYAGGLVIGIGASLITKYLNSSGAIGALPSSLPFLVLFAALLVTPRRWLIERRQMGVQRGLARPRPARQTSMGASIIAGIALLAAPLFMGRKLPLCTIALAFVILFASLGLQVNTSGQVSLCHMTFAAVGASTFARAAGAGVPWSVALLLGGLVAIPVGAMVAVPAIRLSGVYLAIATFGFGLLVQRLFFPSWLMFGGGQEQLHAPRPHWGFLHTATDDGYYYVVLAIAAVCLLAVAVGRRNRLGRFLSGLAQSPTALDAHGANTNVTRVLVFCISAFLAGIGGALMGPITGAATGATFDFSVSLILLAVLFVAGRLPVLGTLAAAFMYVVIPGYITNQTALNNVPIVFGGAAVVAAMVGGTGVLERLGGFARTRDRGRAASPMRSRWVAAANANRPPPPPAPADVELVA